MTPRENLLSLLRRQGCQSVPPTFSLCPALQETYRQATGGETAPADYFGFAERGAPGPRLPEREEPDWGRYYDPPLRNVAWISPYGVAHERGSEAAMHMHHKRHPMAGFDSLEQMQAYPWPDVEASATDHMAPAVEAIRREGHAAMGHLACTVWETAWGIRSMEGLMMDMLEENELAVYLLDTITRHARWKAEAFARAGVDILHLGDDLGSQSTLLMSPELYREWIKPRHTEIIDAVRAIKPDIVVTYHSCGFVTPIIGDLVESGIDVLNPIQPECMDFASIHAAHGDRIGFWGTVGTQTTMPHGTPDEVRRVVHANLEIAGPQGGLWVAPTHVLEPEVPWENVLAYVEACREHATAGA